MRLKNYRWEIYSYRKVAPLALAEVRRQVVKGTGADWTSVTRPAIPWPVGYAASPTGSSTVTVVPCPRALSMRISPW